MKVLLMNCSPVRNGATAEIVNIASKCLKERYNVRSICIDDFNISFCKGCRTCHNTAKCVQCDDIDKIIEKIEVNEECIHIFYKFKKMPSRIAHF